MKRVKIALILFFLTFFISVSNSFAINTAEESPFNEVANIMLQQMEEKITISAEQKQTLKNAFINYLESRENYFNEVNTNSQGIEFDDLLALYQVYEEVERNTLTEIQLNALYGNASEVQLRNNRMGITTFSSCDNGTIISEQTVRLDYFGAINGYVFCIDFGSEHKVSIDWEVELFSPLDYVRITYNNVEEMYSQILKEIKQTSRGSVSSPKSGVVTVYVKTNNNPETNPMTSSGMKFILRKNISVDTVFPGSVQLGSQAAGDGSYGKKLYFGDPNENSDPVWIARYNAGYDTSELRINIGDDQMDKFVVGSELYYMSGFTPVLTAHMNSLRVGINNNEPQYSLDVNGIAKAEGLIAKSITTINDQNLQLQTNGTTRMTISNATGNIGIGVIDPTHKLEVNGTIRTQEVLIEVANWADHVFADDYQLLPINEVKSFIDENKHLPGIPSEAKVKENGVGLSEMQTLFLQKIEELTLYIIDQQQTIDELNKKINELEAKIK
ncbi:hypothetical protein LJB98_02540 [Bacteroidales bacterium OttesenSCG-928-M11]|nr:hypothetical protein [Bacteroidales bacterium OttesenSCG-928-M11]